MTDFHFESPDPDAHGRVTNPGRYSVVVEEAYGLIDDLVRTFGANEHWIPDFDLPKDPVEAIDHRILRPEQGVSLAFVVTDFPGVLVRFGN